MDAHSSLSHDAHAADAHGHPHQSWWRQNVFSIDHKVVGMQYLVTALVFLLIGFSFMLLMRWQLAYPGQSLNWERFKGNIAISVSNGVGSVTSTLTGREFKPQPFPAATPYDPAKPEPTLLGKLFGKASMPGGVMAPDFYNSLGAMHGTIMVFLAIVPLLTGAFGNYVMPLQVGAPDMCFPRLNMMSYWTYFVGGVVMLSSFFVPGGAAKSGWTSYPPLSVVSDQLPNWPSILSGQSVWILGMVFLITSSLLGSVNIICTITQLRARGLKWMRLPFFVWSQFVTAFLLLLAFPPLESAAIMQLMDRVAGTSFFMPSGLVVGGNLVHVSGGGTPLLWQHLFWFLAHPEVYVLILPGLGMVCEVIANNTRKPIWGYKSLVFATFFLGFVSFLVWAHHMYLTGMGTVVSSFFQATTIIISVPSVIILTALVISLWGGSIRFTVPMLFATAFLPMFGIGGLTGIPLAFSATDLYLHDTYYVIGHFHYVVAPGTIFAIFAGIYYWYPKATGRMMNSFLGKLHFWPTFILMNCIFMPMFLQGMGGMHRRWYDGGQSWELAKNIVHWNEFIGVAAFLLAISQIPFIINFFGSLKWGPKATDNPWDSTTLEWSTPTPPGHGNFLHEPVVDKGPYEYSVPGMTRDFAMQDANDGKTDAGPAAHDMEIPYTVAARPDTGLYNAKLGIWLFLASEVMLFAGVFSAYVFLRLGADVWPRGYLNTWMGLFNTTVLISSSITMLMSWASLKMRNFKSSQRWLLATILLGILFLGVKAKEYNDKFHHYGAFIKQESYSKYKSALEAEGARVTYHPETRLYEVTGHLEKSSAEEIVLLPDLKRGVPTEAKEIDIALADVERWGAFYPRYSSFFAIYFTLTGLHVLHLIGGIVVLAYFYFFGSRIYRQNPEHQANRLEVCGLFWHFVDLVWIFLFPVLYLL